MAAEDLRVKRIDGHTTRATLGSPWHVPVPVTVAVKLEAPPLPPTEEAPRASVAGLERVGRSVLETPTARAAALKGSTGVYDNARCYSAVAYWHALTAGVIDVSSRTFMSWMKSPLVTSIDATSAREGDIIAMGPDNPSGVPVDHVAVFDRDRTLFHKAGSPSEFPFELLSKTDFVTRYEDQVPQAKYFRVTTSLRDYLTSNSALAAALPIVDEIEKHEAALGRFIVVRNGPPEGSRFDQWCDDFAAANKAARAAGDRLETLARAQFKDGGIPEHNAIWRLIASRAADLTGMDDPFS